MENHPPRIDYFQNNSFNPPPGFTQRPWFRMRRFVLFMMVFLLAAITGLIYSYSRPAVYRSSATLLTSAMTAIDRDSNPADIQHVVIQKQMLLNPDLVAKSLARLKASDSAQTIQQLTLQGISSLLSVEPVAETNLVEIRAEGTDPGVLPLLVNTLIDVYSEARAEEIKTLTGTTTEIISHELTKLGDNITAKRNELDVFRKTNDIASTGRLENEPLAQLQGINDTYNKASEDLIKAKATLDAVKSAIARGQAIVPSQQQGSLVALEKRLQELKEQLAEFDKRYTRDYLKKQPALRVIPDQIKKLEAEIKNKLDYGQQILLTQAESNYAAARQSLTEIRAQLAENKKLAAEFTAKFSRHEALKTDLEGLEKLYRETQERLVQLEAGQQENYPQAAIISRAHESFKPIRPYYSRDALIILAGSVILALITVWIADYLTRKPDSKAAFALPEIHIYNPAAKEMLDYPQTVAKPIEQKHNFALSSPELRELSGHQLRTLLKVSNLKAKQLIGCLLSGLTLEEAAALKKQHIDSEHALVNIGGASVRTLAISHSLLLLMQKSGGHPAWEGDNPSIADELAALLACAAIDSGLTNPEEITADAIRHSYIAYLVRQGLRLSELELITGYLEPAVLASYRSYSPPQQGRGIDDIELHHPALIDPALTNAS